MCAAWDQELLMQKCNAYSLFKVTITNQTQEERKYNKKSQPKDKKERCKKVIAIGIYTRRDKQYKTPQICISCTRRENIFQTYCMKPNISLESTEQNLEQFLRKKTSAISEEWKNKWKEGRKGGREGMMEGRMEGRKC